jgi:hypothetical protein
MHLSKAIRIFWGAAWRSLLFCAIIGAGLWFMNRNDRWDAKQAVASAENYPTGRVGLVVVGLAQPEYFEPKFFVNFLEKIFTEAIPWPINTLAGADTGIVLTDPDRPFSAARFEPTRLADIWGREQDVDGIDWIEKYRRGEIRWEKPSASVPHDTGFFLYPARKQGMRTAAAKTSAKARYIYYANLPGGYLPHYSQTVGMANEAIALARQRHPIVAAEFADAFDPGQKEKAVRRVLDSGIDTLVLASVQPIHSDFEELRGSYSAVHKVVEAWRKEHDGKPIRIVVAPSLATQPAFDTLWLRHFANTVPAATAPGQTAMGIISLHGLPVSLIESDSWSGQVKQVTDRLKPQVAEILRSKGYADVVVEAGPEGFADRLEDPDEKVTSVAELFARAEREKRALAIALPIEFLAENTDTLFAHSALMFDGLPGYSLYQGPPADIDWSKPFVRQFSRGDTTFIYAGSPGGAEQPLASEALATSIGSVFRK